MRHVEIMWSEGMPETARPTYNRFHAWFVHISLSWYNPSRRVTCYVGESPTSDPVERARQMEEFLSSARRYS